jgi:hypothetical protein
MRGSRHVQAPDCRAPTGPSDFAAESDSPRIPAVAYCQGTPLRNEIEARDAARLGEVTELAAAEVARRFGEGAIDGKIQAHVVTVER